MMAWLLIAIGVVAAPFGLIRALRAHPTFFPYIMVLFLKGVSVFGPLFKKHLVKKERGGQDQAAAEDAKELSNEIFKVAGSLTLADAKRLRDALVDLDSVPTIANGLNELGYKSMIECYVKRDFFKRTTPYTHPLQQPGLFLPGIPAKTFYDPSEFEWARILEDNYEVIRAELDGVLADGGRGFKFYRTEYVTDLKYWNTFNLWTQGDKVEENCARVPRTTEILESLPRFEKDLIFFSALNPKSHLPRHFGPMNGILRGHLPLIVPPGCRIQVGDDVREWEEGKVMVFDDSFRHEVWNESDQVRIVLFMDFWHPAIRDEDVAAIEHFRQLWDNVHPLGIAHRKALDEPRPHTIADGAVPPLKAS